jgi:FecR-like protein
MKKERTPDYLWDGSGEPDPEIARLESVLSTLRRTPPMPALPPREGRMDDGSNSSRSRLRSGIMMLAAAAVLFLAAGAAWLTVGQRRLGWQVQRIEGAPILDGRALVTDGRLGVGKWLVTDAESKARVSVGQIGRVDVDPNSRLQLVESRAREHRMSLERGTIHAQIWAPPKFFYVNTPSAVAIDLGCAYTLNVGEDGSGLVRVTHGWVGFEHAGRESFIPERAVCETRPGYGPGTPRYEDAPNGYAEALSLLDFGAPDDPARARALDVILVNARPRDALTLWHLLRRGTADERRRVFDRMAQVAPPPDGVTRDAVLSGDRRAIDRWWDSLGLESTTWWRLWKKNW